MLQTINNIRLGREKFLSVWLAVYLTKVFVFFLLNLLYRSIITMDDRREEEGNRLIKKIKANPSVAVGLLGLAGVVAYRLYNIKGRSKRLSLYLIELRLVAQGTLMACIVSGAAYKIYQDVTKPKEEKKKH